MLAKTLSVFFFLTLATARLHDSCTCHNGDSYNWRMTTNACTDYNDSKFEWGGATYDTPSGRCTQITAEDKIAGKQWEAACKKIALSGFQCADGVGTCYADPDDVRGRC
ncbi:hypothetical protein N0V84_001090 [Fusarium piperis]|uniref:Uncharacterized protein n=1 Tax=Fusarium piperis TaxID=1435070 RepID=A0A9W8WM28_9HYPO|nr:hypothetical protein N0V84_001090 [Fusarium piperis]